MRKNSIIFLFFVICSISLLFAQNNKKISYNYSIVGYNGKDTIQFGVTTLDEKGILQINLGDYTGSVTLISLSSEFQEIQQHFNNISQINSEETFNAAKSYINDTLSFENLYHSGLWKEYVQQWIGFYARVTGNPNEFASVFVPVAKKVLNRTYTAHPQTAAALGKDLIEFFEQYGLEQAAESIAAYSIGLDIPDGQHSEIASRLATASKLIGKQAPEITGLKNRQAAMTQTLLIFYESGCHNCENEMSQLVSNYPTLKKKGIRIISISADTDESVFEFHSKGFPWEEKCCDYKGFEGDNFRNYGVAATPTIYLIDEKGCIRGKYARLADTGVLVKS